MDKGTERRRKIIYLIKDLVMKEITKKDEIPEVIREFILHDYGLADGPEPIAVADANDEVMEFVVKLEDHISEKYKERKMENVILETEVEPEKNFRKACESFESAKRNYFQVTLSLISLLNEIVEYKEKYSEYLKKKSLIKQTEMEVLEKKMYFLKLQFFLKFYSENNAFKAHMKLNSILNEQLKNLKLQLNALVELESKYTELKDNKNYLSLLQTYKQLQKREKKLDYMIETFG